MKKQANNYAFIDGNNLYLAIRDVGWRLDYQRFRRYLAEKYGVTTAYLFLTALCNGTGTCSCSNQRSATRTVRSRGMLMRSLFCKQ